MEVKWLPRAHLTGSGRPVLLSGEVERSLLSSVDLESEENPNLPPLRSGLLVLTSHRILWIDASSTAAHSIPLAAVVHAFPPKKSVRSMFHSPRVRIQVTASRDGVVGETGGSVVITIVIRGKSDPDAFYGKLTEVVRARLWEAGEQSAGSDGREAGSGSGEAAAARMRMPVVGVSGILRKEQEMWESTDKSLQDAFQDLNALMLADFVKLPLEKGGGMIALIDVYCLFNRARGTELISPEDLLQACALWEKFDVPIMLRKFDSGVMVIQSKAHSDDEVFASITSLAQKPDALRTGISPSDAALTLGIAPALAKEHLLSAENKGLLCRDVSPEGFRFYINFLREIDPSDIHSVNESGLFQSWVSAISASS